MGTDDAMPRRLGPKRANKIRKMFNLDKKDDVRKFVVRRDTGKRKKAPKIQRLITDKLLQRKRANRAKVRNKAIAGRAAGVEFAKRVAEFKQEKRDARAAEVAKKKKKVEK